LAYKKLHVRSAEGIIKADGNTILGGTATNSSSVLRARSLGRANDDAGHVVGKQLGGNGGVDYIFPQSININRGAFAIYESKIKAQVIQRKSVYIVVELIYGSTLEPTRPTKIKYRVYTDATKKSVIQIDPNNPGDFLNP
jgi:hypothetical protein